MSETAAVRPPGMTELDEQDYRAGVICEHKFYLCPTEGRRCTMHGGCCNSPSSVHWTRAEQAALKPGAQVELQAHRTLPSMVLTVAGEGKEVAGFKWIPLSPKTDGKQWSIAFGACGGAHYEHASGAGAGGMGGVFALRMLVRQGALL